MSKVKKLVEYLNYIGALVLLAGLVLRVILPGIYSIVYLSGAVVFAVTQFLLRPRYEGLVMRRLVSQQQLAGLFLVGAGILMFTHYNNEWIVILLCGALMELYCVFRLSHEIKKLEDNKK
jgi:hypothetical protein